MDLIYKLLIPLFAIIFGIILKFTNHKQNQGLKKYWWIFVLIGILIFAVRLINYLLFK